MTHARFAHERGRSASWAPSWGGHYASVGGASTALAIRIRSYPLRWRRLLLSSPGMENRVAHRSLRRSREARRGRRRAAAPPMAARPLDLLLIPLPLFVAYIQLALRWSYSEGERAGFVQKFSLKGWVCKTWEGELAMSTIPGSMPAALPIHRARRRGRGPHQPDDGPARLAQLRAAPRPADQLLWRNQPLRDRRPASALAIPRRLQLEQLGVAPALRQQLLVRADRLDRVPRASTRMRSAMRTLEKRCEISTAVLPALSSLKRWNTSNSARASSAAVGSSRISTCASRM